jgi:hypothetical protein
MVIYLFLVFIIVVLAYMYCTERKIAERYKAIASDFDKEVKELQKECELMKSKIKGIKKTAK